jgi:Exo-beta-D-glucosaminidase Ig-fold domain
MINRYGAPTGMKDFCDKMQLMNADGYRGIFEAAAHKLSETGGVMLWKLNAAFPSVIWQVYDWYLEPNAGYYFMQQACAPLHVQLNLDDSMVAVINRSYQSKTNLIVDADVLDINGKSLYHHSQKINIDTTTAKEVFPVADMLAKQNDVVFVVLHLEDQDGKTISSNVYWMQPTHDFTSVKNMHAANVEVKVISSVKEKSELRYTLQFTNTSNMFAFFINPQLMVDNDEVMPCFWSNNYFSLMANESMTVTVSCPLEKLNNKKPLIVTSGWNVEQHQMQLQ